MGSMLLCIVLLFSGAVSAQTWNVDNNTSNSIQNTINHEASNGDTLNLSAGKYKGTGELGIYKSLTINGPAYNGTPTAVIDGDLVEIQNVKVTLRNLLIINSHNNYYNTRDGGGIYNYGEVYLINCVIKNNSAVNGGGIYNDGIAHILNSVIQNNSAVNGGGIYSYRGKLDIINSKIINNNATECGGGIYNNITLNISDSDIAGNIALNSGGGIFNNNTCTLTNNSFIQYNTANGNGGGIFNNHTCTLTDHSSIYKNTAKSNGGGVYNEKNCIIDDSKLDFNTAKSNGGGIYNEGTCNATDYSVIKYNIANNGAGIYCDGNCTVSYCNITDNYAINGTGGGISNAGFDNCIVTGCNITNNNALYNGGGLYNSGGHFTLNKSSINSNTAIDGNGGGIDNDYSTDYTKQDYGVLTFTNCVINSNIAEDGNGGGIYNPGGVCTLNKCSVINNTAFMSGGGIYNQAINIGTYKASTCTINSSTIANNTATYGGGIYYSGNGKCTIINSTLINNVAFSVGGGISNTGTNCTITGNIIKNNYAAHAGGGIYNLGNCTIHFSELYNNNAYLGSAIYNKGRSLDALMNWWGTNTPNFTSLIYGNAPNTWFIMKLNATPSTINKNSTSKITANLLYDNNNVYHNPANGHLPNGISITFTTNSSYGSINSPVTLSNGQATATFKSKTTSITTTVYAKLDNQTVSTTIKIQ